LDEFCLDDECLLENRDYCWIEKGHTSAVAFSKAREWDVAKIEWAINNGVLSCPHQGPVPKATVVKVVKIAKNSKELSGDFKAFLC
jgi:hypothetical protein